MFIIIKQISLKNNFLPVSIKKSRAVIALFHIDHVQVRQARWQSLLPPDPAHLSGRVELEDGVVIGEVVELVVVSDAS